MLVAQWVKQIRSRYQAQLLRIASLRKRIRTLWYLSSFDWSQPHKEQLPRAHPKDQAVIIDISNPIEELHETIRKENTGEA